MLIVEAEAERVCSECDAVAHCRPYGEDGADICFTCGMKDEAKTLRQFNKMIDGETP